MALPNNEVSVDAQPAPLLNPDNIAYSPHLVFERGGVNLQDTSEGNISYVWRGRYRDNRIEIERDGIETIPILSGLHDVDSIDIAFDQNMNVVVAYDIFPNSYLYWFDNSVSSYQTLTFNNCRSPRVSLDDKRTQFLNASDVIFAYIKSNGDLAYRQQRDRYLIERVINTGLPDSLYLEKIGMTVTNRFYFKVSPFYIMPTCPINNIVSGLL